MDTYLRKATKDDRDLLFMWANDESVRKNSFSTASISYEEHCAWFAHNLNCDTTGQYIYMLGEIPIGQIRIDIIENKAEIGYSIDPAYRQQGHGMLAVGLLEKQVKNDFPNVEYLIAKVKEGNSTSQNIFIKNGFQKEYECFSYKVSIR